MRNLFEIIEDIDVLLCNDHGGCISLDDMSGKEFHLFRTESWKFLLMQVFQNTQPSQYIGLLPQRL